VEIDLSVVSALLGISDFFHLSRRTTVIQDILVRRQFSLVPENLTNVNVKPVDTNHGKTTRIPNTPETGTLLKHGTDRNENFGNKIKIILKTAIKSFESRRFFWVGRLTVNKQHFNLGLIVIKLIILITLVTNLWNLYFFMKNYSCRTFNYYNKYDFMVYLGIKSHPYMMMYLLSQIERKKYSVIYICLPWNIHVHTLYPLPLSCICHLCQMNHWRCC
jgi:hypothetical protein